MLAIAVCAAIKLGLSYSYKQIFDMEFDKLLMLPSLKSLKTEIEIKMMPIISLNSKIYI